MEDKPGSPGATLGETLDRLRADGVTVVHVGLFDLFGTFRERRLRVEDVPEMLGSDATFVDVLPHWDVGERVFSRGPFVGEPVAIVPASARPYPFESDASILIAEYKGRSAAISPRTVLRSQVDKLDALGLEARAAFEFEFVVLDQDADALRAKGFGGVESFAKDNRCWAGESAATHSELVAALDQTLRDGAIDVYALGLELGPGCFEATLRHQAPLEAADAAALFKLFTKAFFRRRDLTASFMAQIAAEFPGLSGHLHLSLVDKHTGKNVFFDATEPDSMSAQFKHFVAGMLALAPESMPFTHQTVNAYRRHAPGNWAPKTASWAIQNYSAGVRIVNDSESRCRLEYRLPGADTNPYLTLAFALGAGLWGLEKRASLPAPLTGGGPDESPEGMSPLPHDLLSASERLERSAAARYVWGDRFVEHLVSACRSENAALARCVSDAERARYLEVV